MAGRTKEEDDCIEEGELRDPHTPEEEVRTEYQRGGWVHG
jgi:hypothetical protein